MRSRAVGSAFFALIVAFASGASAQDKSCRVEPFDGAMSSQGAVAHMTIEAGRASCSITSYGVPKDRRNPAYSGAVTSAPSHGAATFHAPDVTYTPEPGFTGTDAFAYEAIAKGNIDQQVRLRVRVEVQVVATPKGR